LRQAIDRILKELSAMMICHWLDWQFVKSGIENENCFLEFLSTPLASLTVDRQVVHQLAFG